MERRNIYIGLSVVFAASILAVILLPAAEYIKGMMAVPGVGALVGALYQLARDSAEFERRKYLQTDQQLFNLGASSHMSTVAFDKHVAFCEAYMTEVHETVGTLFREGPTEKATECAERLFALKREYAAWIPKSIALELEPFENSLHKLGVQSHLVEALRSDQHEARSKAIDESYALFTNVLGLEKMKENDPDHKQEIAIENVKERVREILGINELFEIRRFIIRRSAEFVRKSA